MLDQMMREVYNIYCDESCHLEHDHNPIMLFGATWCPTSEVRNINTSIRALKEKHNAKGELKWNKVSNSKRLFYLEIIDLFFNNNLLHFRTLVVDNKSKLEHSYFNQGDHDSFYYKMYYYLLRNIISIKNTYCVYLDIKDTQSQKKINTLQGILNRKFRESNQDTVSRIQQIRSHESEILQITDFFLGAVSYQNRKLSSNKTKLEIISKICERAGTSLERTTPPWEDKFNIFIFSPRELSCG